MKEDLIKKVDKFMFAGPLGPATQLVSELVREIKFLEQRIPITDERILKEQVEVRGEHIALLKEKNQNLEKALEQLSREYNSLSDLAADDAREAKRTIERLTKQVRDYAFDANNNFAICNNISDIKENERLTKELEERDQYIKGLEHERLEARSAVLYARDTLKKLGRLYDI